MASTSFSLSTQLTCLRFSSLHSPDHQTLCRPSRISASFSTAVRTSNNALHTVSFYEVLGVGTGATRQEIKSAYRKLARALHPDVASGGRGDDTSTADEFMRVHVAYATLSDPEKRAAYDSSLLRQRRRAASPLRSDFSDLTRRRRSWESDQCW